MSSQAVALYLVELGNNQRKLEYCKQLLASNTSFLPECVFNLRDPLNTNTQSKSEFISNIRSLELGCTEQEEALLFHYFQIDGKNYITFGEFSDIILPQQDPSIRKIIAMRKKEQFVLDYSLRFSLQKYFFQVVESQVKLELMCRFTFPKHDDKLKTKRLDLEGFGLFMKAHGKYPDPRTAQLIVHEMNLNKGDCKRHRLICHYICEYNEKAKRKEKLPEVMPKDPVVLSLSKLNSQTENKENKSNNMGSLVIKNELFQQSKIRPNHLFSNSKIDKLAVSSIMPEVRGNPLENINEVEKRINQLMTQVKAKHPSSSPIKQMPTFSSRKQSQRRDQKEQKQKEDKSEAREESRIKGSAVVESVKKEYQREKVSRVDIKLTDSKHLDLAKISKVSKYERDSAPYFTDRNKPSLENQPRAYKNQTDRFLQRKKEDKYQRQSNASSQLVFKPKSRIVESSLMGSPDKLPLESNQGKYSKNVDLGSKQDQKIEDPYKKRIDYLKSLMNRHP